MYTNFFSLSELPFSIAPDPKYLFMSDRHREALTHLNYGLGSSANKNANFAGTGGFVLLTGEVGTGKTTVSRCLMADLPESTQLAFILNPTLSSQELLATICDQLNIRYRKTGATLKTLTDKISEKLLTNHKNDIDTLLIIDEAQHLAPEVLEQLRLLTNLETNTKKLLQVILIGQPELQQLLKRRDLRQLAQRITARYHLLPLNQQELAAYIKHRLSVADCHRVLFNKGALSAIYKLSQGIPRLVNLICHHALMEAYNTNNAVVDKKIVYKAANQALGEDFKQSTWWQFKYSNMAIAASALLLVLFSLILFSGFWLGQRGSLKEQRPEAELLEKAQPKEVLPHVEKSELQDKTEPQEKTVQQTISKTLPVELKPVELKVVELKPVEPESKNFQEKKPQAPQALVAKKQPQPISKVVIDKPTPLKVKKQNYQVEAVDGVSDDLLARFQAAINETKSSNLKETDLYTSQVNTQVKNGVNYADNHANNQIKPLTQMPAWVQKGIPSLDFKQHIYASDGEGWVNVNGRDRYEGDVIADGLILDKILPQQVILTYRGEKFSLPALTNW
ncbi:MAG: AAA family ATPase [Colwellia sp.]|nr:AAA family ATPase [Colwellia sp.]